MNSKQQGQTYGYRPDGSLKSGGYFGEIHRIDDPKSVSTELSIGVDLNGKNQPIPLLVPTLNRTEIDYLMMGGEPTKDIVKKAVDYSVLRIKSGKSPFAQPEEEQFPVPLPKNRLLDYKKPQR